MAADVRLVARDLTDDDDSLGIVGAAEVAQTMAEAILTPLGSLVYAPEAGSSLPLWINRTVSDAQMIDELRRVAITIPGVVAPSVVVTVETDPHRYTVRFTGPADESVTLTVPDITQPDDSGVPPVPVRDYSLMQTAPGAFILLGPGSRLRV